MIYIVTSPFLRPEKTDLFMLIKLEYPFKKIYFAGFVQKYDNNILKDISKKIILFIKLVMSSSVQET